MAIATSNSVVVPAINGSNGSLEDEIINGLVQGGSWVFSGPRDLTYAFNLNDDGAGNPGPGGDWTVNFTTAVTQALTAWSNVANINFQQVTSGTYYYESSADLTFTLTGNDLENLLGPGVVGLGIFPSQTFAGELFDPAQYPDAAGDVFLDNYSTTFNSLGIGSSGFWVILHEIGHALGLKHVFDDGDNFRPTFTELGISFYDSLRNTVMTSLPFGPGYAATPMPLDILALQYVYGANMSFHAGNDVYTPNAGNYFQTWWDAGGTDVVDVSGWATAEGVLVSLVPGTFSGSFGQMKTNTIAYNVVIENAIGSIGNDSLFGNDAANYLTGNGGTDTLNGGAGADTLDGGIGADIFIGGTGADLFFVDNEGDSVSEADTDAASVDVIRSTVSYALLSAVERLELLGPNASSGTGSYIANVIVGNNLNNHLNGGAGADTLVGASGDDNYVVDDSGDYIVEQDGEGYDTVFSTASFVLSAGVEKLWLDGSGHINGSGNAGDNYLRGNTGTNVLDAAGGNDTLDGGSGLNDTLIGGSGDDVFYIGVSSEVVVEGLNEGFDVVYSYATYTLSAHVENLALYDMFGSIDGTGNAADNLITGNIFNNVLSGGNGGIDTLAGGNGADTYDVDAGDVVVELANQGSDLVRSNVSYVLGANIESLLLTGTDPVSGTGDASENRITGNAAANHIYGMGGNDVLFGDSGADSLDGGDGADNLYGDAGDDTLSGGAGFDWMSGGVGNDVYIVDTALPSYGLALYGDAGEHLSRGEAYSYNGETGTFTVLQLQDATFDGLIDRIRLMYSDPSDFWFIDIGTSKLGVNLAVGSYPDALPVQNYLNNPVAAELSVQGNGSGNGAWSSSFSVHELVIDYSGASPVLSHFSASFLQFNSQTWSGPALHGVINYNAVTTVVESGIEMPGEGIDVVRTGLSATLADNVENLVLTGSANSSGGGNSAGNVLSGNVGNNVLNGLAGADIIAGGLGNDTYVVDNSGDQVMELGNSGTDLIQSSVTYNLMQSWHVENLTLTGGNAVNGSGNWLNNLIIGNGVANVMDGGRGNDTVNGGGGSDTLIGGLGDDVLVWDVLDAKVDGGDSADMLRVDGSGVTLDLTLIANTLITDVEVINITGSGNNTLTLALADVLAISSTTDVLRIDGNAGDVVNAGSGWVSGGTQVIGVQSYNMYVQAGATLLVDADITVSLL